MERKLASIQKVIEIIPIKNADNVELAKVLEWIVLVKKGYFHVGDLAVFFEIDSVLPELPEFEFVRQKRFRIKTMKSTRLSVVSQGLLMPLSILPIVDNITYKEGDDVTKILKVQKYEPPTEAGKNSKPRGLFPTHLVPKTDEMRIQSIPNLLDEIKGLPYVMTIKLDGTSFTCGCWKGDIFVCSRNLELLEGAGDVYWKIAHKYDLPNKLKEYCKTTERNLAIQGEICGPLTQKNPLNLRIDELFVFSVFDIDDRKYVDTDIAMSIAKDLDLKFVPMCEKGDSFNYTVEQLIEKSRGKYDGTDNNREGLVIRPQKSVYSPSLGNQLSFKIINLDYLLEEK